MRIAVSYENGQVFQHFGHSEQFKLYEVEGKQVLSSQVISAQGSGHGALAGFLSAARVDTLICGGIGGGAQAVEAYLNGTLAYVPDMVCSHHSHGGGHDCGSHGCGGHDHSCGGHDHGCGGHCGG